MNPVQRFFRRYIFSTIGILALFFVVNIALVLSVMTAGYMSGTDNGLSVREVSGHVTEQAGTWTADGTALAMLREHDAWAMLLDERGAVVWEQDLPEELPRSYTSAEVASFSRWYLQDYPVKVWSREDGALMVVGFEPDTLVKYYFSMETPSLMMFLVGAIAVFVFNLLLMVFLMLRNTRRVEKAMSPILRGIQDLSRGSYQPLDERGELAEINAGLPGRARGTGGDQRGAEPGWGLFDAERQHPGRVDSRGIPRHPHSPFHGTGLRQRTGG